MPRFQTRFERLIEEVQYKSGDIEDIEFAYERLVKYVSCYKTSASNILPTM